MIQIQTTEFVEKTIDESKRYRLRAEGLLSEHRDKEAALMLKRSIDLCIEAASLDMTQTEISTNTEDMVSEKV